LIWSKYYQDKVPYAARDVGSFWWKDVLRLSTIYRGIARCTLGDGSSVTFWDDLWSDGIIFLKFPRLHSFAIDPNVSVKRIMQIDDLSMLFHLPLSPRLSKRSFPYSLISRLSPMTSIMWTRGIFYGVTVITLPEDSTS